MNSQADLLREARERLEAGVACGSPEQELKPLVYRMNHANDQYKIAAKHVKVHAAPPKPKGAAKTAPKASAKGGKK
ncbi:unnamed protein product, partial [Symbiodinium sp. CCMP2592]